MSEFSKRLRDIRRSHNVSQEYVSSFLEVVRSTYAYYENGKTCPSINSLIIIAELFGISLNYLLTGKEYEQKTTYSEEKASTQMIDPSQNIELCDFEKNIPMDSMNDMERRIIYAFRCIPISEQRKIMIFMEQHAYEEAQKHFNSDY